MKYKRTNQLMGRIRSMTSKELKNIIEGEFATNLFQKKEVRKTFHNNEWWWVLEDVISVITDTADARDYIKKMKSRDDGLKEGWGQIVTPLLIPTKGGKQNINCSNLQGLLRIIQSVPSDKAEPFKKWLAKTGFERIQEQQNPDLITQRMMLTYQLQGRDERWIRNRIDGAITRKELTTEWKNRDVKEGQEFATLTNIISQETFGISISQHKEYKGLKKENLRDNMTEMELIFQRMGEQATIDEVKAQNAQGFDANKQATRKGASNAGIARQAYEKASGRKVVSCENFIKNIKQAQLDMPKNDKIKRKDSKYK
ncbi:MAG: Bro-N domain-containing protein [Rickettsiales bacterium]|nr:Bro-N domain-containing protein [Rickettsiales bacterium]